MRPARGPLALTSGVAVVSVVSVGLLWLALAQGWLGADVGRGDGFCEAAQDQLVRQPANAFSNAGFVLAGLLVAWHMDRHHDPTWVLTRAHGTAYAVLVVLLGPGSAAMHASQSRIGGHLDTSSMYLLASFAASYAISRRWHLTGASYGALFAVLLIGCELVDVWGPAVPVVMTAGNLVFGLLLLTSVTLEVEMSRSPHRVVDLRWGIASLASMVVAFTIWNGAKQGTPFCRPDSLFQGHAVWHLLCAVAAYCLYRLYASERSEPGNAWLGSVTASAAADSAGRTGTDPPGPGRR